MAIELLPLLEDTSPPPTPESGDALPTSTSDQETVDALAEYLDQFSPDFREYAIPNLTYENTRSIYNLLVGPDASPHSAIEGLRWLIPLLPPVVGATVALAAETINTLFNRAPEGEEPSIFDKVTATYEGGALSDWWGNVPFDTTDPRWVLVDTDTFTDAIHFFATGHVYLVSLIPPIMSRSEELIDSEVVHFGAGWWSEMVGTNRGERHYLDFEDNIIHQRGTLMRGVFVNLPKGGDGQVAAYRFTP